MLWFQADPLEIGISRKVQGFSGEIRTFVRKQRGCRNLISESVYFWNEKRQILLPFCSENRTLDFSFLIGVVDLGSLDVVSAVKRGSARLQGYEVMGFAVNDSVLQSVDKQEFLGFRSARWLVSSIGDLGYTVYVHVNGTWSVRKFSVKRKDGSLMLHNELIVSVEEGNILSDRDLQRLHARHPFVSFSDLDFLAEKAYDCYVGLQRFRDDTPATEKAVS